MHHIGFRPAMLCRVVQQPEPLRTSNPVLECHSDMFVYGMRPWIRLVLRQRHSLKPVVPVYGLGSVLLGTSLRRLRLNDFQWLISDGLGQLLEGGT